MIWSDLFAAAALCIVFEGIVPFISPLRMKRVYKYMSEMEERQLRIGGLVSMLLGLVLLYWVRS